MKGMTRRDFLGTALGCAGAIAGGGCLAAGIAGSGGSGETSKGSPIAKIEVFPIAIPFLKEFRTSGGLIGSPTVPGPHVYVKVTAEDGTTGWGESRPSPRWSYETPETVVSTIRRHLAPALIGHDPHDIQGAARLMDRVIALGPSGGQPIAKAGIEVAIHDLSARLRGINVARLWGRDPGKATTLSYTVTSSHPEGIRREVRLGQEAGYRNFNCKIGHDYETDRKLLEAMRKAEPNGFLWADANRAFTLPGALKILPVLREYGFGAFEQPTADAHGSELALIRTASGPVMILVDEVLCDLRDLAEYIRRDAVDGITLKVTRMGGLRATHLAVEMARAAGLEVLISGLTESGVGLMAGSALSASHDIPYPAALNGPQLIAESILKGGWPVKGGVVQVTRGPGLGVEVDEEALARLNRDPFSPSPAGS